MHGVAWRSRSWTETPILRMRHTRRKHHNSNRIRPQPPPLIDFHQRMPVSRGSRPPENPQKPADIKSTSCRGNRYPPHLNEDVYPPRPSSSRIGPLARTHQRYQTTNWKIRNKYFAAATVPSVRALKSAAFHPRRPDSVNQYPKLCSRGKTCLPSSLRWPFVTKVPNKNP